MEFRVMQHITETQHHVKKLYAIDEENEKLNRYPDIIPCIIYNQINIIEL